MNRDFEFKQLLRAYRSGIISEKTFETEMAALEQGHAGSNGGGKGFEALGKVYSTEREAVIAMLDRFRAGEANGMAAFSGWNKSVSTDCIRSGIRMICEREGYHARIFEQRLKDLGADCKAEVNEASKKITATLSDTAKSDNEKLMYLFGLAPDPEAFFKPVLEFVDRIQEDQETKELFKLYVQDEISSAKWLNYACEALNGPAPAKAPAGSASLSGSDSLI